MTALPALKILIVDDEAESRMALKAILNELGIAEIYEAADGNHALRLVGDLPGLVDLILCDWNMPVMSGIEFFRALRERGSATPLLMITGRADHRSVEEARENGIEAYIRKPFSPQQVETRLRVLAARMKAA